jgi:hypothetical protein
MQIGSGSFLSAIRLIPDRTITWHVASKSIFNASFALGNNATGDTPAEASHGAVPCSRLCRNRTKKSRKVEFFTAGAAHS